MSVVSPDGDLPSVGSQRPWRFVRGGQVSDAISLTGAGALSGVVRVAGVPAARKVEVYDQLTLTLAGTTVSDGTSGAWTASGLTTARPLRVIYRGEDGERDVTIQGVYAT